MLRALSCGALLWSLTAVVMACPTDTVSRKAGVLLTVQGAGAESLSMEAADLAALPAARLTQRHTVTSGASAASEHSTVYAGVLLRDVLSGAGFGAAADRGARVGVVEAIATDGYRAVFSWGELFNSSAGQHVLIITSQDGRALDNAAGPLALRALDDLRPGPRHVRNLCAVVVRR